MHSNMNRMLTICSIMFNAIVGLLFAVSLLTFVYEKKDFTNDLKIISVQPSSTEFSERNIKFNPNIDLTDIFHLNVKQVFLYLKISHSNKREMIWSKIIQKNDPKKLDSIIKNNYRFFNIENGSDVKFELRGCIFPHVGITQDKLFSQKNLTIHS